MAFGHHAFIMEISSKIKTKKNEEVSLLTDESGEAAQRLTRVCFSSKRLRNNASIAQV